MNGENTQLRVKMIGCDVQTRAAFGATAWEPEKAAPREPALVVTLVIGENQTIVLVQNLNPDEARGVLARWMAFCEGEAPRPTFSLDIAHALIAN